MKGIITFVLFYYIKTIVAQDLCQQFPIPDNIYFNETSAAGSIIFVSNETNSTKQDWTIATNARVALTLVNKTYQVTLLTVVDLDVPNPSDNCLSGLEQFLEIITCTRTGGQEPVTKDVTFHVRPVNEYPPDVIAIPGIQISEENVTLPYFLARLLDYIKDRDCPKEHLVLSITKYSSDEKDASQYFMVNSSTGYLYQIEHFDYEDTYIQCGLGKGGGNFYITAEDGPHSTSKSLEVTFVDVDDSPPVFVYIGCTSTCYQCPVSSLSAKVLDSYQGPIQSDQTEPSIKAMDPDTPPSNTITYTIDVFPAKYNGIIKFENGRFGLLQSFANFTTGSREKSDFIVTVIMQATGSNGQTSDKFVFTIYVIVRPISSISQQITERVFLSSTKDIIITVLAVVVAILLFVILVYAVCRPDDICSPPEQFVQRIACYCNGQYPIIHWVTFQARSVNENQPEADTLPDIQISEGFVSLPLFLYSLLDYFKDRDCPKERLVLSISKYSSEKLNIQQSWKLHFEYNFA